jgi:hypothetical protein
VFALLLQAGTTNGVGTGPAVVVETEDLFALGALDGSIPQIHVGVPRATLVAVEMHEACFASEVAFIVEGAVTAIVVGVEAFVAFDANVVLVLDGLFALGALELLFFFFALLEAVAANNTVRTGSRIGEAFSAQSMRFQNLGTLCARGALPEHVVVEVFAALGTLRAMVLAQAIRQVE